MDKAAEEGGKELMLRYKAKEYNKDILAADTWARNEIDRLHKAAKAYINNDRTLKDGLGFILKEKPLMLSRTL